MEGGKEQALADGSKQPWPPLGYFSCLALLEQVLYLEDSAALSFICPGPVLFTL